MEERVLAAMGLGRPSLAAARLRAERNATSVETELLANGTLQAAAYYEALASLLGLPYLARIVPEHVVPMQHLDVALAQPFMVRIETAGRPVLVVAPAAGRLEPLMHWMQRHPEMAADLAVAAPATIREAVWASRADSRAAETVRGLFESAATMSARTVMTGSQGFALGAGLTALAVGLAAAPGRTLALLHPLLSGLFFLCVGLRALALVFWRKAETPSPTPADAAGLPIYTVLVALHREAAVAGQLIRAMQRLRWPRSRIEFKLVCEADDAETLGALTALALPPEFEIIRVPPLVPRTKPKALDYALAGIRGSFLAIYDAEDWPHPDQLLEAHAVFSRAPEQLAVLQAPLIVCNMEASWISGLFALEYAALFRGLLPLLARFGLPLPLGGTSNHFRVSALRACGAWDPHNVTEDADLGMRLFRRGYRGGVLRLGTLEAAPDDAAVWMNQRTRWFKGWLQTFLVMMRAPLTLLRELGPAGFVTFQLLILGMLVSALGHPLLIGFVASTAIEIAGRGQGSVSGYDRALLAIDAWNFAGGYLVFILLALRSMSAEERRRSGLAWIRVPAYWLAMSAASWRAMAQLIRKPHYWSKTPHQPFRRGTTAMARPHQPVADRPER